MVEGTQTEQRVQSGGKVTLTSAEAGSTQGLLGYTVLSAAVMAT